jgi:hypothetical protein
MSSGEAVGLSEDGVVVVVVVVVKMTSVIFDISYELAE